MENDVKNSLRRSYIICVKSLTHVVIFLKLKEIQTPTTLFPYTTLFRSRKSVV